MKEGVVLLVEDNADDELLTLRAFRKSKIGNEVVVARDGAEALRYLFGDESGSDGGADAAPGPLPTLVLLDLNLPKVDGIEVLRRIRSHERTRFLPVVVLTTSNEEKDLLAAYGYGCNSYVRKPVDFDGFVEATRQLGLYWLLLNERPPAR
jgi:two-component system, response regulator